MLTVASGFTNPGISNAGHIGGLAGGLAAALAAAKWSPSRWMRESRAQQDAVARQAAAALVPARRIVDATQLETDSVELRPSPAYIVILATAGLVLIGGAGAQLLSPFG